MFSFVFALFMGLSHYELSKEFLDSGELIITVAGNDITLVVKQYWHIFSTCYTVLCFTALFFCGWMLYRAFVEPFITGVKAGTIATNSVKTPLFPWRKNLLQMVIGLRHDKFTLNLTERPSWVVVPETGMFQNFLITGTIGTGKTAAVMYPLCKQALYYKADDEDEKAGMLILDVKGNFYEKVLEFAQDCGREGDIVLIKLGGKYKYNPLHKPNMEPVDLAGRTRQVLEIISGGSGSKDAFWDDKAANMVGECVRLLRLVNNGYVSLGLIHELVTNKAYLSDMLARMEFMYGKQRKTSGHELDDGQFEDEDDIEVVVNGHELSEEDYEERRIKFDYEHCLNYFTGEFSADSGTVIETIKTCVTRITNFFVSSMSVHESFSPDKIEDLNFHGFEDVINKGKIVVLAMNVEERPIVARTIAAYLKQDFQAEVLQRTVSTRGLNRTRPVFFICDEYQEFVGAKDANFYGVSREAKCCSIVASQSYTSLLKTLGDEKAFNTLQQNLINKIWLRGDDKLTIETAQQLTGKEEKRKYSTNISESMADARHSKIFGSLVGNKTSVSESTNVSTQRDFVFEERIFTQTLEMFKAVCFLAHDKGMQEPSVVHLLPYFEPYIDKKIKISVEPSDYFTL
jgi:hypothetical protein